MSKQELVVYVQIEGGDNKGLESRRLPVKCDLCDKWDLEEFVDGQCRHGGWANMCMDCFKKNGIRLGVGLGQRYKLREKVNPQIAGRGLRNKLDDIRLRVLSKSMMEDKIKECERNISIFEKEIGKAKLARNVAQLGLATAQYSRWVGS